jgi:hypothetical protein
LSSAGYLGKDRVLDGSERRKSILNTQLVEVGKMNPKV